jgi:hypothetical protein
MFVFDSRGSTRTRTVTNDLWGCTGRAAMSPDPRFEVRELGEIDMVPTALATMDLVAGLAGETGRVLRHGSKALVLCAGDRDLTTLLAYLAALRLGTPSGCPGPLLYSGAADTGTESWWYEPPRQPGAWPARCARCSADQR